jgi:FtsP/CotA-like multicopper oxidase with cupredoxin domain
MQQGPRVVRNDQVECRGFGRLRAMLVALAALILAVLPAQRADNLLEVHVQSALPGAPDASVAGFEKAPAKRLHAAVLDGDPGTVAGPDISVRPDHVSRLARSHAAWVPQHQLSPDLPPARGPPAPVA